MALYDARPLSSPRWASFENPLGEKGMGGRANRGAKGRAFLKVGAGETVRLLEAQGSGVVRRIWMTLRERVPGVLRALVLRMYWDGQEKPAVECPLGDFFANGLCEVVPFESELFSSPEGKSFNCFIPMPFRKGAKIELENQSGQDLPWLFYDVDYTLEQVAPTALYFHTYFSRENPTRFRRDYTVLPKVSGHGRFLGMSAGVVGAGRYKGSWFGEGEVKMYLDGDGAYPTLCGTGIEDYIGTAWGQGEYAHRTQGCLTADGQKGRFAFYRFHTLDPIYFHSDIRVTMQQIGGAPREAALAMARENTPHFQIISGDSESLGFQGLYEEGDFALCEDNAKWDWYNYYRIDDCASAAYFYLDSPASGLPPMIGLAERTEASFFENEK